MTRVTYIEAPCKAALNRVQGMPFKCSLNPYRGCVHGCHYCYARASHSYLGRDPSRDFASVVQVKTNMPAVLRRELARPSWTGEKVAIGTATDPYQPCEGRYRLTRRLLEVLTEARNPASVVTKSTLILRDRDLLSELAGYADVSVYMTVTTLDPAIWREMEPGTPPPAKRLMVMERLVEAGVRCGVFLAPVLPGISDSLESITEVARVARAHGASSFGAAALRLAPMVKDHYLTVIAEQRPDLLARYQRAYPGAYAPQRYLTVLEERIAEARTLAGFDGNVMDRASMREKPPAPHARIEARPRQLGLSLAFP